MTQQTYTNLEELMAATKQAAIKQVVDSPVILEEVADIKEPEVKVNIEPEVIITKTIDIDPSSIISDVSALSLHEAINFALRKEKKEPVFKVAALQSGYTAEITALGFSDITRIQASSLDQYAARVKLLRTLHSNITEFSCNKIPFQEWLSKTAQGDYDTLMYGLYAATYPGENEFDVKCQHCGHDNKVKVDVTQLARIENDNVYEQIRSLLDPKTNFKGAISESLVGRTVYRRLPESGFVAEIRNPSIQDYLDGVQWFVKVQDNKTGMLPDELAGAEVIRTLAMHVSKILVPVPGTDGKFYPVSGQAERSTLIGKLSNTDGKELTNAVDEESKLLQVSYTLPPYHCASCQKINEELYLDFEALLFIKLQEKV
jgi:hypothetical protein